MIDAHDDAAPGRGPHADLAGQLLNALTRARWFAGKGRRAELTGHTTLGWLTEVDHWPAVRIEIVEVSYPPDEDPEARCDVQTKPVEGQTAGAPDDPYGNYQVTVSDWAAPVTELGEAELAP